MPNFGARLPEAEILMGTGNLTELTDADSGGITAVLLGIASELAIRNVLTVQVSPHTRRTLEEHDMARRMMLAARADASLPRDYSDGLLALHERRPFAAEPAEVAQMAAAVRDGNYRVEVAADGIHVFNRERHLTGADAFGFFPDLGVEADGGHAFYLGVELGRAEIAYRLGKRYTQDAGLRWGVAVDAAAEDLTRLKEAGTTLSHTIRAKSEDMTAMPMIRESIVITTDADGAAHIAPLGLIEAAGGFIVAPFHPSRTLENLRARPCLTASVTDDVRVFAGCLTGRRDWPVERAAKVAGFYLEGAHAHRELEVVSVSEDEAAGGAVPLRPRFLCRVVHEVAHAPAPGFNRAQNAVIEAAILVSRLHMLSEEKVRGELAYLDIAIGKTAGPRELQAWGWLLAKIEAHFAAEG